MSSLNHLLHGLTRIWCAQYRNNFLKASLDIEKCQQQRLKEILTQVHKAPAHAGLGLSPKMTWKDYSQALPISDYNTWKPWIEDHRDTKVSPLTNSLNERFQPTSGSTSAIKWIPYSQAFLDEINTSLMTWVGDMYRLVPGINSGYHYWSVSWIPTNLRSEVGENVNDDLKVLPWWKRWVASQYMAVPETVAQAESSDDTMFASLAWLLSRRDLSLLSVWSPTFALSLFEQIHSNRDELIDVLNKGNWQDRSQSLRHTRCPKSPETAALLKDCNASLDSAFLNRVWPNLSMITSWDTASSKVWADKLHQLFPNAVFQGKGLLATEGTVTIPFSGKYPLTLNSHYYEFLDLSSNEIVPSWKLEKGMEVSPVLTTGTGFLRYQLKDRLVVNDFLNSCPCFEFKGRLDGTDLSGEKLSTEIGQQVVDEFRLNEGVVPVSMAAIPGQHWSQVSDIEPKGHYVLICEPTDAMEKNVEALSAKLDAILQENFHYQLARELKQLGQAKVIISPRASDFYFYRCAQRGMADGNIKIEPLVMWNTDLPDEMVSLLRKQINSADQQPAQQASA